MSNRLTVLRALSVLGAAGGVALAGCSSATTAAGGVSATTTGAGPTGALLRQAAAKTAAASGARVSGHATLAGATGAGSAAALHVSDSGVVSFPRRAAAMTVIVRGGPVLHVRLIGASVYERESGQSRWSRVSQASQARSVATTMLTPGDPATVMDYLRFPATSVTRVGTQTVGGVPTTEYTATLHPSIETSKLGMPLHVWIDRQGRVRQVTIAVLTQVTASPGAAATRSVDSMNLTVDFSDFGIRPVISAPAN
ncbi:MAG TPA: hypothetical protein VGI58_03450 [Streptosporangiaceae bacterium]|jgi:hypothetical protein